MQVKVGKNVASEFFFISILILLSRRKASEALYIEQLLSNYPNLLLKMPEILLFGWNFFAFYFLFINVIEIENCLSRLPTRKKWPKVPFLKTQ